MLMITLGLVKSFNPCADGVAQFIERFKPVDDDQQFRMDDIVNGMDFDYAFWSLRATLPSQSKVRDRVARLFACDCAEIVLPIFERACPQDQRPRQAIKVARRFAMGEATSEELAAAGAAARAAARAKLEPTVKELQLSALDLLDRLIAVTETT